MNKLIKFSKELRELMEKYDADIYLADVGTGFTPYIEISVKENDNLMYEYEAPLNYIDKDFEIQGGIIKKVKLEKRK